MKTILTRITSLLAFRADLQLSLAAVV